jgi:hypothetical protein
LIVEGIKTVVQIGRQPSEVLDDDIPLALEDDPFLSTLFEQAADHTASLEQVVGETRALEVTKFLRTPEVEAIVRQIFATGLDGASQNPNRLV